MIKDIVVKLSLASPDHAGDFALSLAAAFEADVTAVAFAYEPEILPDPSGQGSRRFMRLREENEEGASAAAAAFEKQAGDAGVTAATRVMTTTLSASYDLFGQIARRFDLAVVGQDEPETEQSEALVAEGALFESGRPLILVPYIHKTGLKLDRVMVCWDGSRPAARALADAMPLLTRARQVDVVIVAQAKSEEIPGADVAEHLARHGVNVTVQRIAPGDLDVKDTLLNYAADSTADMIVMGGYGHSRMREFILGGVTRGMLASMTVPTLMSH
ncbi:MAG: universal stress protein [Bradyrhizobiaceae bacterium]|nr:universal stress protein [Bradyrhizobiaceae bacterium]